MASAPSKSRRRRFWPDPSAASDKQVDECKRKWADRGIKIVAAQSLLFGKPELTLFENAETRKRTQDYLQRVIHVCARLGAEAQVFGSPKNRRVGDNDRGKAVAEAKHFFRDLGKFAAGEGTHVVMEANPTEYGADFVTKAMEAVDLVREVDQPGYRLHLDTACMTMAHDSIPDVFETGFPYLRHFHISEPQLAPVGTGGVDHAAFARELRQRKYEHWVSIEMRETQPFDLSAIEMAVEMVQRVYLQK